MLKENPEELPKVKMHQLDKQFFGNDKITVCKKWVVFTIDNVDAENLKKLLEQKYSNVAFKNVTFRNNTTVLYVKKQFSSKITLKEGDVYDKVKAERITESICDGRAFCYIASILADILDYYKIKVNALVNSLDKFSSLTIKETSHIINLDK